MATPRIEKTLFHLVCVCPAFLLPSIQNDTRQKRYMQIHNQKQNVKLKCAPEI